MRIVYKYELIAGHTVKLPIPPTAEVLCAKIQRNTICIWVLQDDNYGYVPRDFYRSFMVVGTGASFDNIIKGYIDTVMTDDHTYVFHVFEVM